MGVYDYLLGSSHTNLIAGQPRTVRSDEWTVNTPFTIAQKDENYPVFNKDVGSGQDMSVVIDVPYADWSVLFHPQNLIFFIAPLAFAFPFKWWLLLAVLMFSVYVFVLLLYPKRYLLASLLAFFFGFSPFIQWWNQSITILPIAYSLLLVVLFFRIIRTKKLLHSILLSILLSYILVCFILIMYPAFQISVALVAVAVTIALLAANKEFRLVIRRRNLLLIGAALAFAAIVTLLFVSQHIEAIKATLSTIYPGSRNIVSGGFNPIKLATWPLSYLLLDSQTSFIFNNNQSEISNFMLFGFIVIIILLAWWLIKRNIRTKLTKQEIFLIIAVGLLSLLIFWRMFIPFGDFVFNLLGLSKVPHVRLFIALGVINLIFLAIAVGRKSKDIHSFKELAGRTHGLIFLLTLIGYSLFIGFLVHHFVISTIGWREGTLIVTTLSLITTLLLSEFKQLRYIGLVLMCLFSFVSCFLANPLYRGLEVESNPLVSYVKETEKDNSSYWIANDKPYLSSLILASGAELYGGVNTYPQTALWKKYFPTQADIYNRYAHIRFKIDNTVSVSKLSLVQADSFRVTLNSCDPLLSDLKINYIVSDENLGDMLPCFTSKTTHVFSQKPLYIYSR